MSNFVLIKIQNLGEPNTLNSPPGDPRLWDALRQSIGEIPCDVSTIVGVDLSHEPKASFPPASFFQFWLGFPGIHKVTVLKEIPRLCVQVRRKGNETEALATLLRERMKKDGFAENPGIWVARQFEFADSPPLRAALNTFMTLGAKSGIFHPLNEEARVLSPGASFEWAREQANVEILKDAFQKAYLGGFWASLHRNYRIQEFRPRMETESRDLEDPLVAEFQSPAAKNSVKALEGLPAPLTFIAGLPNVPDAYSNVDRLQSETEKLAALEDRPIGTVMIRESPTPLLTLDTFPILPLNQKSLPESPGNDFKLYMIGPWDSRNPVLERRVEYWVRGQGRDALLHSELVNGEQDFILYFTHVIAREAGWVVDEEAAKALIVLNSQRSPSDRAWFFWSTNTPEDFKHSASRDGVPLRALGQKKTSGKCDFTQDGREIDGFRLAGLKSEPKDIVDVRWSYPEIKSPTYGFDKAALFPDQYLLKVTARSPREKSWSLKSQMFPSAGRMRSVVVRRKEASALSYFRWTNGREMWAEALGTKEGWVDVDPKAAGAAAADAAIRGIIALGGKPDGGTAGLWATQPITEERVDRMEENSRLWGAYILSLEGACSYLKAFDMELTSIEGNGLSFPKMRQELIVKIRSQLSPKLNPVVPGFRMVGEVLYAIGPRPAFVDAGSRVLSHVRVMSNHTGKLNPAVQLELYRLVCDLISRGKVTCIRPVGEGGIVQTLGEMALWGGMGAQIRPNLPVIELFSASPGRFVIGILPQEAKNVEAMVKSEQLTTLGLTGGEKILGLPLNQFFDERGGEIE